MARPHIDAVLPGSVASGAASPSRVLRALVAGAVAGAALGSLVGSGVLGPAGLLVLLALIVCAPVATSLSGRLALGGTAVLGWTPLLWWLPWRLDVNHGAVLVGLIGAGVVAWVAGQQDGRLARRRLRPRVRWIDAVAPALALGAAGAMGRWLSVSEPQAALSLLLRGYDNVGHFDMFAMLRTHGASAARLGPAPDGSGWAYADYPQGFHALAATMAGVAGRPVGSAAADLVTYAHAVAVVVVATTLCLAAALCAAPDLRRRPALAAGAAVVVTWTAVAGLGGGTVTDGFAPFWFATALVSTVLALCLGVRPRRLSAHAAAIGGALVGITWSWAPLLLLAVPALAVATGPLRTVALDPRRLGRVTLLAVGLVGLATVSVVGTVVMGLIRNVGVEHVVVAVGGISPPEPRRLVTVLVLALLISLTVSRRSLSRVPLRDRGLLVAARLLGLVVIAGTGSAVALALQQLRATGTLAYYFMKYVTAVEVVLVTVLVLSVCALAAPWLDRPDARARPAYVASVLALAVLMSLALSPRPIRPALLSDEAPATGVRGTSVARAQLATQILGASELDVDNAVLVVHAPGVLTAAALPETWRLAIRQEWSVTAADRAAELTGTPAATPAEVARQARLILRRDTSARVLVPPAVVEDVRAGLDGPAMELRVTSWSP